MTSFMLLLTIVIDTHFTPLKDLSKAFALYDKWQMTKEKWQMTNDNLKRTHNLISSYLQDMNNL